MANVSVDFYKSLTEYIYGIEFTSQEEGTVRRKYNQFFSGEKCLQIGTQKNSDAFCEFVWELWGSRERYRTKAMEARKDRKLEKDYNFICEELQDMKDKFDLYKKQVDREYQEKLQGNIEETTPYKQLVYKYKMLNENVSNCQGLNDKIQSLKDELSSAQCGSAEFELTLKENNKKLLEKEKKKLTAEFEKQSKNCDKMDVAQYKKQIQELEEKNKKLKRIIETSL